MAEATLLIRADAGPEIGTGHVMRCLALAQGWQDAGGNAVFATTAKIPGLERRLVSEKFAVECVPAQAGSVQDAALTNELASRVRAKFTVLDGYCFGRDYQAVVKASGQKILVIDDFGQMQGHNSDLVLDQNSGATPDHYAARAPNTQLLLGPEYVLLRREFSAWREWNRKHEETGTHVLVTMGGADPDNLTLGVMQALKQVQVEGLIATVLVGAANPHVAALERAARGDCSIRLAHSVANVPSEMARADVGIICGGGTLWELLFMGVPVVSYSRGQIQSRILSELAAHGAVSWQGEGDDFDDSRLAEHITHVLTSRACRERMGQAGRTVVDGLGVHRALRAMGMQPAGRERVRMVSISMSEKDEFMRMAAQYFSELDAAFLPHEDWKRHYFETIQSSPEHFLRWLVDGDQRVGFILFGVERHRFLPRDTGMIYDLYVAPEHRKKGIARWSAQRALAELRSLSPTKIQLETMQGNGAANALWTSLGFRKVAERFVLQEDAR
jgi:UDP-2,4-diacetamido-2,4,6-trideoxy-beta-L-altropyranose hydrolase